MRVATGRGYVGTKDLSAGRSRGRDQDINSEGRAGHEAVDETACGTLLGYAIVAILHVWTGWPDEKGQI